VLLSAAAVPALTYATCSYPVETVRMAVSICRQAESVFDHKVSQSNSKWNCSTRFSGQNEQKKQDSQV
jgi:pyruvate kinase